MNVYAWVLLAAYGLTAVVDWLAVARGQRDLESVAKPAVIAVLGLLAWLLRADSVSYGVALLVALGLSLLGDVLLLSDSQRRFHAGLVAFLLAHLAYIVAILRLPGPGPIWPGVGLVTLAGVLAIWWFWPRLRADWLGQAPVLLYAVVVVAMTALAWASGHLVLAVGATLFLLSDLSIGWLRFGGSLPGDRVPTMVTYHLAQLLLVLGLLRA